MTYYEDGGWIGWLSFLTFIVGVGVWLCWTIIAAMLVWMVAAVLLFMYFTLYNRSE